MMWTLCGYHARSKRHGRQTYGECITLLGSCYALDQQDTRRPQNYPPHLFDLSGRQSSRIVFPRESRDTEARSVVRHDGDPVTRPVLKRYFIEKERVKGESDNPNNGGRDHHSEP